VSIISKIFQSYKKALFESQKRYEDAYSKNAKEALQFYNDFLKDLFINYGDMFSKPHLFFAIIRYDGIPAS